MTKIRIATFNCENLFARYRFRDDITPRRGDFTINELAFDIYDETEKQITARAIRDVDADIICLQEVDNLPLLERFNSRYLAKCKYRHRMLIDGNDPRAIDVGILSRLPLTSVRSERYRRNKANTAALFSRDCLRADVDIGNGKSLTLYVNHLKSMMGGRKQTKPRRQEQAEAVRDIIEADWGETLDGDFIVLGDLNDYGGAGTALDALLKHKHLVNILDQAKKDDRWTHFWSGGNEYRQLDYLLLSKRLDTSTGKPKPDRLLKGLPWRADRYDGDRYDEVGQNEPKASDHVPLFVDIDV